MDSGTTAPPYRKAIPLWKAALWIVGIIIALLGFFIFDPVGLMRPWKDGALLHILKENREAHEMIDKAQDSIGLAQHLLKQNFKEYQRIVDMAGLSHAVSDSDQQGALLDDSPEDADGIIGPARNMKRIRRSHAVFRALLDSLQADPEKAQSLPVMHPLKRHNHVTSRFGLVLDRHTGLQLPHKGIDFATFDGDTVLAPGAGIITSIQADSGMGLNLTLVHNERTQTFYGHLKSTLVRYGQSVKRGQPIALVGNSGRSSGPHLHYEVRILGESVDPAMYFIAP